MSIMNLCEKKNAMKVQSRAIFSCREWRSSAESLLSSDIVLNFPPEQLC